MLILSEDYWYVKDTPQKGRGVFVKKEIPGGTVIGDYLGTLLPTKEENKTGPTYAMTYNELAIIVPPNPAAIGVHSVNHSCMPNCDTFPYKGHVLLFALRKIFLGEELSYVYLIDPPPEGNKPVLMHPCRCGSLICHGTMNTTDQILKKTEEFIKKVESEEYSHTLPVPFGQMLPPLKEYPHEIPDYPVYDIFGSTSEQPLYLNNEIVPSMKKIRELIRESGRMLHFKKIGINIVGIMNYLLIAKHNE